MEQIIKFCRQNDGKLYIYGAGVYGRKVAIWLEENGYSWNGFIETARNCNRLLNKKVVAFSDIDEYDNIAILVCVSEKYQNEILSLLCKSDINNYFVVSKATVAQIDNTNTYIGYYAINRFVNVLLYHRVIDLATDPQLLAVDVDAFDAQIKYLKETYRIIRFEDDWRDIKEKAVVITFDDGYADNYLNALPILEKHRVPATVFVSTGNIDTNNEMWWDELEALFLLNKNLPESIEVCGCKLDLTTPEKIIKSYYEAHRLLKYVDYDLRKKELERLEIELKPLNYPRNEYRAMTSRELKMISESEMITIGGHTVTHTALAKQQREIQEWEIRESKKFIEEIIGKKITTFSYPFGGVLDYSSDTADLVRNVGYEKAAIVKEGLWDIGVNPYHIPRNIVRNWDLRTFERNLNRAWNVYG